MQQRNYCITLWVKPSKAAIQRCDKVRYFICGTETCPDTNRIHWQCFIQMKRPTRPGGILKILGVTKSDWHIEPMHGTVQQASDYCKKNGQFYEIGTAKTQGQRTDLEAIAADLVSGETTLDEVMENHPTTYCKYRNGIRDLAGLGLKKKSKQFRHIETHVLWGDAGVGKTRQAVERCDDDYFILTKSKWWDGYNGEANIIIDDFYGWTEYHRILRWLDGYQLRLPVKGSFTYAMWDKVFITSNKPPEEWYSVGLTPALKRRLTTITYLGCDDVPPGNTMQGVPTQGEKI